MSNEPLMIAVIGLGVLVAGIGIFLWLRGQGPRTQSAEQAFLEDTAQVTRKKKYQLSEKKPLMLGRMLGKSGKFSYLLIPEPTIGRRHALVEFQEHSFWVSDQGSVNGTYLNGRKIARKTRLNHGDVIKLHQFEFRFVLPDMEEEDAEKTVLATDLEATQLVGAGAAGAGPAQPGKAQAAKASPGADWELDFEEDITIDNFIDDQTLSPSKPDQN